VSESGSPNCISGAKYHGERERISVDVSNDEEKKEDEVR